MSFSLAWSGSGTRGWDPKRAPAWCDRIIFRGEEVQPLSYSSVEQAAVLGENITVADGLANVFAMGARLNISAARVVANAEAASIGCVDAHETRGQRVLVGSVVPNAAQSSE